MGGVTPVTPGVLGWAVGFLLIAAGLGWLLFARRRYRSEVTAEHGPARGRVKVPQGYWHPSMGPRREPVTQPLPRCTDGVDAALLIPRQRGVRRG